MRQESYYNPLVRFKKQIQMHKRVFIFIYFLLVAISLTAQHTSFHDLSYGNDSLQKMDVYLNPSHTAKSPVVILVHGGGWMSGDKKDFNFMRDALLTKNVDVININYRLAGASVHYPQIMDDMNSALHYITAHASQWNMRDHGFILWGNSAGGHLALLFAYNYALIRLINAVILFGGPTRVDDIPSLSHAKAEDVKGLLPLIVGKPFNKDSLSSEYHSASPYYGKHFVPTLIIHGTHDQIVPPEQSEMLHKELDRKGVENKYFPLINGAHGGEGASKESHEEFNKITLEWIQMHSKSL